MIVFTESISLMPKELYLYIDANLSHIENTRKRETYFDLKPHYQFLVQNYISTSISFWKILCTTMSMFGNRFMIIKFSMTIMIIMIIKMSFLIFSWHSIWRIMMTLTKENNNSEKSEGSAVVSAWEDSENLIKPRGN